MQTMRDLIKLTETSEELSEAYYDSGLTAKKQQVLDVLDRLLGHQTIDKQQKIAALKEIAAAANRMADGMIRQINDSFR